MYPHRIWSHTGEKLWYKDVQTMGKTSRARRLLPEEYRKAFANKQVVCVEYQDITDADEREIFQVCHGVPFLPSFSQRGPFIEGSTWNGSYTIRSAYYSTLLTDKRYQLTFFFSKLERKTASHKQPSSNLHPGTPNSIFERRRLARRWLAGLGP